MTGVSFIGFLFIGSLVFWGIGICIGSIVKMLHK